MSSPEWFLFPLAGSLLALLCLWAAARCGRRVRLVDCLPTSTTAGVFIGLVELKGIAEAGRPLVSHLAGRDCVHYTWQVDEHWSRTVQETYRDSEGRTRTRTRRESGWKTVARGGRQIPFYLRDDCGVVRVIPDKAKIEPEAFFSETCDRSHPLYYQKGPRTAVAHSDHRRRFVERGVGIGSRLYIMGRARERTDLVAPEIAHDPEAPMFLISTRSEEQVSRGLRWGLRGWAFLGLLLAAGGFVAADLARELDPVGRWPLYLAAAAGYGAVAGLGWLWMVYNSLIDLRNRVRRGGSLIDVQLKRRSDLIPGLVRVVQEFRGHEAAVQVEMAELRTQATATAPGEAGPDPHALEGMLVALAERYPDLKANEMFAQLHQSLVETEHRIALARGYYNEIATHFRTRLEVIPDNLVGRLAGLRPYPLLQADNFEREAVRVEIEEPVATDLEEPEDPPAGAANRVITL